MKERHRDEYFISTGELSACIELKYNAFIWPCLNGWHRDANDLDTMATTILDSLALKVGYPTHCVKRSLGWLGFECFISTRELGAFRFVGFAV